MILTFECAYFKIKRERMSVLNTDNSSTNLTIKITKYLLSKSVVHYVDLMEYTNLSRKTISKYLDRVEQEVVQYGVTLVRKRGAGIYLTGSLDQLRSGLPGCATTEQSDDSHRTELLLFLLELKQPILLDDLAQHFFVSRSTMERDLNYLKDSFGMQLKKTHQGISLNNDELEVRQVLSKLTQENWNQELTENQQTGRLVHDFQIPVFLRKYIDPQILVGVQEVLTEFGQKYDIRANEYQYEPFLVHIAVSMNRISIEKYLDEDEIFDLTISPATHELINLLEEKFKFIIPAVEAKYLELYVSAFNDNFDSFRKLQVVGELISWLKKNLLSYDDELLRSLATHLVPALKRGRMGFDIKNPYTRDIKEKFPTPFDQALDLTLKIQQHFKIALSENEIAYMTLHLELFNKRHPQEASEVTLVIVCSSGYGTAQLLRQRVLESIPDVTIVGTMSVNEFIEKAPVTDIVLTTVPLKMVQARVLQVSPFLNETEVELLKKVCREVRKQEYIHAEFMELLQPECIIVDSQLTNQDEVIQKLTERLRQNGYVDQEMAVSALEREKLASTKLGKIAIPHGGIEHVLKPTLGILTSQAGIQWNEAGPVNLVFFIAFNQQLESQMDDIYAYFYSLIKNKEVIKKLVHAASSADVLRLLEQSELDV